MSKVKLDSYITKKVQSVQETDSLDAASALMREHRIRHLPVWNKAGHLAGILSDRDLKRAVDPANGSFRSGATAGQFMSTPVVSVGSNTPVKDAVDLLLARKLSCLAVLQGQNLLGIITTDDLLRLLKDLLPENERSERSLTVLDYFSLPYVREAMREAQAAGI